MAAVNPQEWEVITPNDMNGGVVGFSVGTPPDASNPFQCPYDPTTGCAGTRRTTYLFTCDQSSTDPSKLSNVVINETSSCNYVISGSTYAACPQVLAFPTPSPSPAAEPKGILTPAQVPVAAGIGVGGVLSGMMLTLGAMAIYGAWTRRGRGFSQFAVQEYGARTPMATPFNSAT